MELAVIEHTEQGFMVVKLRGELDIASSPDVREQLLTVLNTRTPSSLIIDLSELEFMDSSGTAVLVSAEKQAQSLGCEFAVVAPRRPVARVLHICGLDHYLRIFDNLAAVPEAQADQLSLAEHSPVLLERCP
jgi:anti-anti-sigma factor